MIFRHRMINRIFLYEMRLLTTLAKKISHSIPNTRTVRKMENT